MEESLRVEAIASSPEQKAAQIEVMAKLTEGGPAVLIINAAAFIRFLPHRRYFVIIASIFVSMMKLIMRA